MFNSREYISDTSTRMLNYGNKCIWEINSRRETEFGMRDALSLISTQLHLCFLHFVHLHFIAKCSSNNLRISTIRTTYQPVNASRLNPNLRLLVWLFSVSYCIYVLFPDTVDSTRMLSKSRPGPFRSRIQRFISRAVPGPRLLVVHTRTGRVSRTFDENSIEVPWFTTSGHVFEVLTMPKRLLRNDAARLYSRHSVYGCINVRWIKMPTGRLIGGVDRFLMNRWVRSEYIHLSY